MPNTTKISIAVLANMMQYQPNLSKSLPVHGLTIRQKHLPPLKTDQHITHLRVHLSPGSAEKNPRFSLFLPTVVPKRVLSFKDERDRGYEFFEASIPSGHPLLEKLQMYLSSLDLRSPYENSLSAFRIQQIITQLFPPLPPSLLSTWSYGAELQYEAKWPTYNPETATVNYRHEVTAHIQFPEFTSSTSQIVNTLEEPPIHAFAPIYRHLLFQMLLPHVPHNWQRIERQTSTWEWVPAPPSSCLPPFFAYIPTNLTISKVISTLYAQPDPFTPENLFVISVEELFPHLLLALPLAQPPLYNLPPEIHIQIALQNLQQRALLLDSMPPIR